MLMSCVMSTNWIVSTCSVICYPALMANFSCSLMKNVHRINIKQHGGIKLGILQSKNLTISHAVLACALSGWKVQKLSYSHECVKIIVLGVFEAIVVKLQQLVISEPDKARHQHGSYSASLSAPFATSQFVLAAHYDVSITSQLAKNI